MSQSSFLSRTSTEEIRNVLDTNLYGAILGSRAVLLEWLGNRRRDRVVINISSLLAVRGGIGASAYAASKAGIIGFTRALADEGKSRGFRANVIVPGYIESEMTESELILFLFAFFSFVFCIMSSSAKGDRPPINAPVVPGCRPPLVMAARQP